MRKKRLEKSKRRCPLAGVVVAGNVKNYALKKGLYVLEPSGETFAITEPGSKGYNPRE
jgi:hypothetical protein